MLDPGPFPTSYAWDMSEDGRIVVGFVKEQALYRFLTIGSSEAAVWIDGSLTQLTGYPGATRSWAGYVSGDGLTVTGTSEPQNPLYHALPFRWDVNSPSTQVQILEGWNLNYAGGGVPNHDASVITGRVDFDPSGPEYDDGFIWKSDGSQVIYLSELLLSAYPEVTGVEGLNLAAASSISCLSQEADGNILSVQVDDENYLVFLTPRVPQIDRLAASTTEVLAGATATTVTLTPVGATDPAGFLAAVEFYDESNVLLARQAANIDGYGLDVIIPGGAVPRDTFTFHAIAEDTEGNLSAAVSTTVTVVDAPSERVIFSENVAILAQTRGKKTDLHVCVNVYRDDGDTVAEPGDDDVDLEGATVTVTLSDPGGSVILNQTGTTDANGLFLSGSVRANDAGLYTATVDLVDMAGFRWTDATGAVIMGETTADYTK